MNHSNFSVYKIDMEGLWRQVAGLYCPNSPIQWVWVGNGKCLFLINSHWQYWCWPRHQTFWESPFYMVEMAVKPGMQSSAHPCLWHSSYGNLSRAQLFTSLLCWKTSQGSALRINEFPTPKQGISLTPSSETAQGTASWILLASPALGPI